MNKGLLPYLKIVVQADNELQHWNLYIDISVSRADDPEITTSNIYVFCQA